MGKWCCSGHHIRFILLCLAAKSRGGSVLAGRRRDRRWTTGAMLFLAQRSQISSIADSDTQRQRDAGATRLASCIQQAEALAVPLARRGPPQLHAGGFWRAVEGVVLHREKSASCGETMLRSREASAWRVSVRVAKENSYSCSGERVCTPKWFQYAWDWCTGLGRGSQWS